MAKNRVITVQGIPVTASYEDIDDFICITDIAAAKSDNSRAADVIRNWLRNRSTLEFLSTWEEIYNPNFKVFESEHFKKEAGLVTFTPSVLLIESSSFFTGLPASITLSIFFSYTAYHFSLSVNFRIQNPAQGI